MKIQLTTPCEVSKEKMTPNNDGAYCNHCNKSVIDYSYMTDAQMLDYIKKYGLGCGEFREDQLNRELIPAQRRKKANVLLLPLLAILFIKPIQTAAQCKQQHYAKIDSINTNKPVIEQAEVYEGAQDNDTGVIKKFGTGNIVIIRRTIYAKIPFTNLCMLLPQYWRNLFTAERPKFIIKNKFNAQ